MKKKILGLVLFLLAVGQVNIMTVSAGTYAKSTISGGYSYRVESKSTADAMRYSLLDSFYYNKKKKITRNVQIDKTVQTSASASVSGTLSTVAGADLKVFGTGANVQISTAIEAGVGISGSKSKTISTSINYVLRKSKDKKGYYVYETFTKGYSSYVQFLKVNCRTGKVLKNNKRAISYSPRKEYSPTGQYNFFTSDPQCTGRYERIYL